MGFAVYIRVSVTANWAMSHVQRCQSYTICSYTIVRQDGGKNHEYGEQKPLKGAQYNFACPLLA